MKKLTILALFAAFSVFSLTSGTFAAAPSLSTIRGSISHGNKIVVEGTNFSTAPWKPLIWADFEQGNTDPTSLGAYTEWDVVENLVVNSAASQQGSSVYNVLGTWGNPPNSFSFRTDWDSYNNIYTYWKRRFNYAPCEIAGGENQKFWRLWPASGSNDFVELCSGGSYRAYNEAGDGQGGAVGSYQGDGPPANQWRVEERYWKYSGGSGRNNDGNLRACSGNGNPDGDCTGIFVSSNNGTTNVERYNIYNDVNTQEQLRTDNFTDTDYLPPVGSKVWMDEIYISTGRMAAVFVTTAATWGASRIRHIQIPQMWQSTSVAVVLNTDDIPAVTQYIYVVTQNGEVNANGLELEASVCDTTELGPMVSGVTTSSFTATWTTAGSAQYQTSVDETSDFASVIASGVITGATSGYVNLSEGTTYFFRVKVSTHEDCDWSDAIEVNIGRTPPAPPATTEKRIRGNTKFRGNIRFKSELFYDRPKRYERI